MDIEKLRIGDKVRDIHTGHEGEVYNIWRVEVVTVRWYDPGRQAIGPWDMRIENLELI